MRAASSSQRSPTRSPPSRWRSRRLTSIVQSAGAANGSRSILKAPAPSLVPMATPSTVIVRFGTAVPSTRSRVPLSSARETVTSPSAAEAANVPMTAAGPATTRKRRIHDESDRHLSQLSANGRHSDLPTPASTPARSMHAVVGGLAEDESGVEAAPLRARRDRPLNRNWRTRVTKECVDHATSLLLRPRGGGESSTQ